MQCQQFDWSEESGDEDHDQLWWRGGILIAWEKTMFHRPLSFVPWWLDVQKVYMPVLLIYFLFLIKYWAKSISTVISISIPSFPPNTNYLLVPSSERSQDCRSSLQLTASSNTYSPINDLSKGRAWLMLRLKYQILCWFMWRKLLFCSMFRHQGS